MLNQVKEQLSSDEKSTLCLTENTLRVNKLNFSINSIANIERNDTQKNNEMF